MLVKRDLFADFTNAKLVRSGRDGTENLIVPPFHEDILFLKIQALEIDTTGNPLQSPYAVIDANGLSLALKVFTSDGADVLASQTSWDITTDGAFQGSLTLNTVAMAAEFTSGSITSISTIWEFEFQDADGKITIQQSNVTIKREYITTGSPIAVPTETYYTKADIDAMFVKYAGNAPGLSIRLTSANALYETELACNDDGSNASNVNV